MVKSKELKWSELSNRCKDIELGFETTEELPGLAGIIGQKRAASAMEFGLSIKRFGYNIFVSGITGTGRSSYARSIANKIAANHKPADDWCYVYNFKNPDRPIAINLPAGIGSEFVEDMDKLIKDLKGKISGIFGGEEYENQKSQIIEEYQKNSARIMEEFNEYAKEQGFMIKRGQQGILTVPIVDGKPIEEEDYANMTAESKKEIEVKSFQVQKQLMDSMKRVKEMEELTKEKIAESESRIALMATEAPIDELLKKYGRSEKVKNYLVMVQEDIIKNIGHFKQSEKAKEEEVPLLKRPPTVDPSMKYNVNLIVDNKDSEGAPVIFDTNPKYYNLLGRIEYDSNMGVITTNFTKIIAGSIHAANGGYLIINISDIAKSPESWDGLKRALKNNCITIENVFTGTNVISGGMKPEPIPLDIKVILIGNAHVYHTLYNYDEDFRKLFKIKADFDIDMQSDIDNVKKYAKFIGSHCRENGLLHFDSGAVASVIDYSRRLADHKNKLSTRFNDIVEVIYEADAWARLDASDFVKRVHVKKALDEKVYRSNRVEEKLQELIDTNVILISTEDKVLGQVNGLSVMNFGDYAFGKPSRITTTVFAGEKGILNIEREVKMSGSIHDKGVLILSGYLGEKFAQEFPLSLSANICFEQLYDGVDGDSASSTELYALLSSLAEVPIKQYIAVTGSVNQKGEIQPIGGVNEKIEGFYQTCKYKGLKGHEGVMIPYQNVVNLMLNDEVIEAVKEGKFHIYPVRTIEEGIEILTDMEAGTKDDEGNYEEGTLFNLVKKKIEKYAKIAESRKAR